jgi:hypothetical protein
MKEKEKVLGYAAENKSVLFFEHDPIIECAFVERTDKGIFLKETFLLNEL